MDSHRLEDSYQLYIEFLITNSNEILNVPEYLNTFLDEWDRVQLDQKKEQLLATPTSDSKKSITSKFGDPPTTPVSSKAAKLLGIATNSKLLDLKDVATPPQFEYNKPVKELKLVKQVNVHNIFEKKSKKVDTKLELYKNVQNKSPDINSPDSNKRLGEFDHNSNQDSPSKRRSTEENVSQNLSKNSQNVSRKYYDSNNRSTSSYNATTSEDDEAFRKPERATTPVINRNEANRQLASNYLNAENLALLPNKYQRQKCRAVGSVMKHASIPSIQKPEKIVKNVKHPKSKQFVQYTLDDSENIVDLQPGIHKSIDDIQMPQKHTRKVTVHRTNSGKMQRPMNVHKRNPEKLSALTDSPNMLNHRLVVNLFSNASNKRPNYPKKHSADLSHLGQPYHQTRRYANAYFHAAGEYHRLHKNH